MPDAVFDDARLARSYDALDPDRTDLEVRDAPDRPGHELVYVARRV
jgi:hypothetical protein